MRIYYLDIIVVFSYFLSSMSDGINFVLYINNDMRYLELEYVSVQTIASKLSFSELEWIFVMCVYFFLVSSKGRAEQKDEKITSSSSNHPKSGISRSNCLRCVPNYLTEWISDHIKLINRKKRAISFSFCWWNENVRVYVCVCVCACVEMNVLQMI